MTNATVLDRFVEAAHRHAARPAILESDRSLTYADLSDMAGGYARALVGAGVRPGDRVALLTPHGTPTIAAILGTLAVGGVYVPLDPGFPIERLRLMCAGSGAATVLADPAHTGLAVDLVGPTGRVVGTDRVVPGPLSPVVVAGDDLAYVLFTSGSTGTPKAVGQTHRNLLHAVQNQIDTLALTPADRLSLLASFGFDAAIPDLYPALLTGATVVPVELRRHGLPYAARELARHRVTVYHSTPTVYRYLLGTLGADRLPDVRVVLLGGEQSTYDDVRRGRAHFAADCLFVNGYGATEVTFAAQYRIRGADLDADRSGPLPIGVALPGYQVSTLPDTGELVVRSHHLAPGYLNQTSDRFGVDPDGVPTYRTGDLGAVDDDGLLRCLGRLDRQVKIRGFRVELTEIESVLSAEPGIVAARAVARDGELLAYVRPTPAGGTDPAPTSAGGTGPVRPEPAGTGPGRPDPARLRAVLAARLPDHALPRAVLVLDEFPLTVTGKIDERALPDPPRPVAPADLPRTATERAVHDIWAAVLRVDPIGRSDSFFDLGGHSLLLGEVQQRLAGRFGVPVPMTRLFAHPTIAAQAAYLDTAGTPEGGTAPATTTGPATGGPLPVGTTREYTGDEIAVVGLAGRFPGAPDVATLWWNLCAGVDAIHDYTDAELADLGIGPGLRADPRHVKAGGLLPGVADFDAEFFGFGADEAARTDPQHRIFLETAWEAMEDAGHDPETFPGLVGVFSATSANRYFLFHLMDNPAVVGTPDPDDWEARLVGRQFTDHLPGQVAYRLGLTGPAVATQSACSSSLVAVSLAAQSLADYQCDIALAGGVSVTWPRYRHTPGGLASPDGRCRAFDEAAAGSGFSSGAGVVVLRRLADALADHDHVYAILPGWAVTNDGAERAGYAVPGPAGQVAAIAGALAAAEVAPGEVGLVEAHGSGTPLGDAIEVSALNEVYRGVAPAGRCALGSIKTNIGHLDAGAGVAGLIKAVLAVRHGVIPPNLHFTRPHPEVELDGGPFHVPTKPAQWPDTARRVAGVSSFGLGGTNAHVVVEQAPPAGPADPDGAVAHLLLLSARTPQALRAVITRLRQHLVTEAPALADVAYTLAVGRRAFGCRAAVAARTLVEAVAALDQLLDTGDDLAGGPAELLALAGGWVDGEDVDGEELYQGDTGRRVPLPTYPFQRDRYWIDPPPKEGQR
ncbi:AMP-binding protein [Micromonospora echinofusca]|uniref:AMP-binding protein n=1 Tax=Micromonospora echinofusca TaxID=47858 RepID=A0ABS3VQN5_MICEH|nr:AMP-binding protein [Micromonospora echinofusca]MBO4206786.1 AMP-binding protein [Micromonospora echinofusca]